MDKPTALASMLNVLRDDLHELAKAKGWYDNAETDAQFVARAVANLHGETSELWEAFRHKKLNEPCDKTKKMKAAGIETLTCLEEELADIIIRAMDVAGRLKVDIGKAVVNKHAYNKSREYRHGGKAA